MSNVTALPREACSIEAPAVESIPLADLYLSDMNPRQEAGPKGIALLADSIATIGLIQPIAGFRDEAGKVGVVAPASSWMVSLRPSYLKAGSIRTLPSSPMTRRVSVLNAP